MFKLQRQFSISSALVIVLIAFATGHMFTWYETRRLVRETEARSATVAELLMAELSRRHGHHLATLGERDPDRLKQDWRTTDIDLFVRQQINRTPIQRVALIAADTTVIYDTALFNIGARANLTPGHVRAAFAGATSSLLVAAPNARVATPDAEATARAVVETALPWRTDALVPAFAMTLHVDVSHAVERIAGDRWLAGLLSAGICLLLHMAMLAIVARADQVMKRQYAELSTFSARLEDKVKARTAHMQLQQRMLADVMKSSEFREGTLQEAIALLNRAATRMLDADRCGIYSVADDPGQYTLLSLFDRRTSEHHAGATVPRTWFACAATGVEVDQVRCVENIATAQDMHPDMLAYCAERDIVSILDVPIFVDGHYKAVLCPRRCRTPRKWTTDEQLCAAAIANLAALVFERVERRKAEAEVKSRAARLAHQQSILTGLALEADWRSDVLADVLKPMSRALAETLQVDDASIWLFDEAGTGFAYAEAYLIAKKGHRSIKPVEGFAAKCFELRRVLPSVQIFNDLAKDPMLASFYERHFKDTNINAAIVSAVMVDGAFAGFVTCGSARGRADWGAEHTLLITSVAHLVALAVERHQRRRAELDLAAAANALSRQQVTLNDILHSSLFRTGALVSVLRLLTRTLGRELNIDRVNLSFLPLDGRSTTPQYSETYIHDSDSFSPPFTSEGWPMTRMLEIFAPGKRVVVDDVDHPDQALPYREDLLRPIGIRSFMQIPIEVSGRIIGIINASTCHRTIHWTAGQKLFATAVASLATLAIERDNRQRFERNAASAAARLEAQHAALTEFMRDPRIRTGSLNDTMRHLTAMCAETLGIDRVGVWLATPDGATAQATDQFDARTREHASGMSVVVADHPAFVDVLLGAGECVVDDVGRDSRMSSLRGACLASAGVRSLLGVAIHVDGAIVGAVIAETCETKTAWTQEQRVFLAAVSSLAALVIERDERQRAEVRVAESAARLTDQFNVVNSLMQADSVRGEAAEGAFGELLTCLARETGGDVVSLHVVPSAEADLSFAGAFDARRGALVDVGAVLPSQADDRADHASFGQLVIVDDVTRETGLTPQQRARLQRHGVGSAMQVPIRLHGAVIGCLRVLTIDRTTRWRPDHKLLVTAIAQIAAQIVERQHRMKIERDLRHANHAAEQASKAKSQFLANMSHEIRTPMNGVFGMTDVLMRTDLTSHQRRLVGIVSESARTLLAIINDILDLSRIEAGKLELDKQPFDLRQCVEGAVELFSEESRRRGLELDLLMSADVPSHVVGDSHRLRQVFVNLLGNALKFTKFGEVALRVRLEGQNGHSVMVHCEVKDTGVGIEKAVLGRLFRPFTQADDSITRRFGGTGLGLSISRHLIEMMGGTIALESELGVGTRVSFAIPLDVAPATPNRSVTTHTALQGRRILVVDDRDSNREIVIDYLAGAGAKPVGVRSGAMALDLLSSEQGTGGAFAVAVIDVVMPDMNGLELCRRVRATAACAELPLVMVSSMSWDGEAAEARALGVARMLTKPLRRGELLDAVAGALAGEELAVPTDPARPATRQSSFRARVLVAEDNPVNEAVARELLAVLGCDVTVVTNGVAACESVERERFDIALMDCQMPVMDGLTATTRIRAGESRSVGVRLPIIAVTANAFESDREACLAAGMDDYLSKPFTEAQLEAMLAKWLPKAAAQPADGPATADPAGEPVAEIMHADIDQAALADVRARRPALFERMLATYLAHTPTTVSALADAAASGNVPTLRLAAHSLKSSSANVGARRLAALSRRLEEMAAAGALADAQAIAAELSSEYAAVAQAFTGELAAFRKIRR